MTAPLTPLIQVLQERFSRKIEVSGTPMLALKSLVEHAKSEAQKEGGFQVDDVIPLLEKTFHQVQWWIPSQSHHELEKIDQQVLNWAKDAGFLDVPPIVRARTKKSILGLKRLPAFYFPTLSDDKGQIMVASDEFGVLGLSKKDNVFFSDYPLEERLFVLFHEAAHSVFEDLKSPFQLPNEFYTDAFTSKDADLINGTYFALGTGNQAITTFNEMFADTYGAMMLLNGCGYSQASQDFITQTIQLRARMQNELEVEKVVGGKRGVKRFIPHNTATALRDLMNNLDRLPHKTPDELKRIACEIASVNWVKWLNPKRMIKNQHGQRVEQGDLAFNRLASKDMAVNTVVHMGMRWMQNATFDAVVKKLHPSVRSHVNKIVEHGVPHLERKISAKQRKKFEITTLIPSALERVIAMLKISKSLQDLDADSDFKTALDKLDSRLEKTHDLVRGKMDVLNQQFAQYATSNPKRKKAKL